MQEAEKKNNSPPPPARDVILSSVAVEVEEDELESAADPVSLGLTSAFYDDICFGGERSKCRTWRWVLRLLGRVFFVVVVIPIPLFIDLAKQTFCSFHRPVLREDVNDVLQKIVTLRVRLLVF